MLEALRKGEYSARETVAGQGSSADRCFFLVGKDADCPQVSRRAFGLFAAKAEDVDAANAEEYLEVCVRSSAKGSYLKLVPGSFVYCWLTRRLASHSNRIFVTRQERLPPRARVCVSTVCLCTKGRAQPIRTHTDLPRGRESEAARVATISISSRHLTEQRRPLVLRAPRL